MKNKSFGIETVKKSGFPRKLDVRQGVFCGLLLFAFCIFSLYAGISKMIFSDDKVDLFTKDLTQIALYFTPIDRDLSQKILVLNDVVQSYMAGDNVFQTRKNEIDDLRKYIIDNQSYLQKVGFANYEPIMELFDQMYEYRDEIYKLLGQDQPFHYLVLLQNGNEKRPNGGFFGSFAFVSFDGGHIQDLQIVDSYLPDYVAPNVRLEAPKWFSDAFGENKIGFIAGNKFGFTDKDGKNLKLLFERMVGPDANPDRIAQMFSTGDWQMIQGKYVKGIIFLNSELIELFFPGFEKKMREWQFVNATIDLIRGEYTSNKKELYIQQVNEYFQEQKFTIVRNLVNSRVTIPEKNYLQFYFSNVSSGFQDLLVKNNLTNLYSTNKIYMRDVNSASNKSDQFMIKHVQLLDEEENVLLVANGDILDLSQMGGLEKGKKYCLQLDYDFQLEDRYVQYIRELEKKYKITLTPREEHILVLKPLLYDGETELHWWSARGMVYLPPQVKILSIEGDAKKFGQFYPEFAKGVWYGLTTDKSSASLSQKIWFEVN
ncbi:hypothetical protein AGMMS50249_1510 [candidate division SR1 bacterium]|nr:hypothetical protein AGMMS50249_1510 [candidate division SR1 bacterium]